MVESTANPAPPAPKKMFVTYDAVHNSIASSLPQLEAAGFHHPDYLIAVSGGGLIPARMLRTMLREHASANGKSKGSVAIIRVIGLELYNDDAEGKQYETGVLRTQWLTEQTFSDLAGKTVLIVDEVRSGRGNSAWEHCVFCWVIPMCCWATTVCCWVIICSHVLPHDTVSCTSDCILIATNHCVLHTHNNHAHTPNTRWMIAASPCRLLSRRCYVTFRHRKHASSRKQGLHHKHE